MSDLKIQGEVSMSAGNTNDVLDGISKKADQMAGRLQSAGEKAGAAVDNIGKSANDNAEQFTRAEGRISDSIKRATKNLELMGKTASQKLEIRISDQGLDASKFEPMLLKLRELEAAQIKAGTAGRGMGGQLQNTSYQLQDFIVQVNGGTDATKALGQQLPQMLVGFGAAGAAIGVVAALLPNIISAFGATTAKAAPLKDVITGVEGAFATLQKATDEFSMAKIIDSFNAAGKEARSATIDVMKFNLAVAGRELSALEKSISETTGKLKDFTGLFGSTASDQINKFFDIKSLQGNAKDYESFLKFQKEVIAGSLDMNTAYASYGSLFAKYSDAGAQFGKSLGLLKDKRLELAKATDVLTAAEKAGDTGKLEGGTEKVKKLAVETDKLALVMDKLTGKNIGLDATYWRDLDTLHTAFLQNKFDAKDAEKNTRAYADAVGTLTNNQKFAKEIDKQRADLMENMLGADLKRVTTLQKSNESLVDEIHMLGMSKDQQALYRAAKIDSAAADELATAAAIENNLEEMRINGAMPEIIAGYEALAAAKRAAAEQLSAQADLERQKSAKEIAVKARDDASNAWKQFGQEINRSLTDSLYRSFESGESFGKAFIKSLKNTFKTAGLKLVIGATLDSAGGLVSLGLNALTGASNSNNGNGTNYLGLASNASTAYGLATGSTLGYLQAAQAGYGLTSAEAAAAAQAYYQAGYYGTGAAIQAGSLASTGSIASASGTAASGGSGAATSGSSGSMAGVSSVAWIAAIVAGMYMSSEAWRKGIRWENYAKQDSVKSWDAEVALRAMHDEPMRAIFGDKFVNSQLYAILGGGSLSAQIHYAIQGALFGKKYSTGTQTTGTFSEDQQGFSGLYGVNMKKTGGLFSSGRTWTDWYALPDQVDSIMDSLYKGVRNSFIVLGETFDDTSLAAKLKGFSYAFTVASTDMTTVANAASANLSEAIGAILTPSVASLEKTGETWTTAFQRILLETNAVGRSVELMGKTMSGVFGKNNLDGVLKASDAFITLFGTIDAYNTAFNAYYANYYTQAEQSKQAWADMAKSFTAIGLGMPSTRQGFKDLVNSLDLSTAAGQSSFAALMALQAGFAALTPSIDDVTAATQALLTANREAQAQQISKYLEAQRTAQQDIVKNAITATEATATAAQGVADTFTALLADLGDYKKSLLLGDASTLSPAAKYAEARRLYEDTVTKARLGDTDAAGKLQSAADAFLKASLATGTSSSYALDFGNVVGTVTSVMGVAERQIPLAESQLKVAQDQLTALNDILASLTGTKTPAVVANYQQAATDWASFFSTTAIGDVVQTAAGAMQRISESMGMFIDKAGQGFTFSSSDNPYTLANSSDAWRQYMLSKYGQYQVPGFAAGGYHKGGLRLVGEVGKEMEITGPSHIVNSNDTRSMLDNWSDMLLELKALREEVATLREDQRAGNAAIANNTSRGAKMLEKFDVDGLPEVRVA